MRNDPIGHPLKPIWKFYNRGKQLNSSGHYEAICKACEKLFSQEKPTLMKKHIIINCVYVSEEVKEAVIYIVESCEKTSNISRTKHLSEQISLDEFLESTAIPDKHIESINKTLIKAFVCCGLPWMLIKHLFFIEFLKQLRPAYTPPSRKFIAENLLINEIIRIDTNLYKSLKDSKNLTLGGGLKTYIDTRWTTVYTMLKSVYQLETCLKEQLFVEKKDFFYDVYDLAKIFKPINNTIIKLQKRNITLANCYFALISLGNSIYKLSKEDLNDPKQFYKYAINKFNSRFSTGIKKSQFLKIATSAANIWQQMVKIPKIATQLKKYKHSKEQSGDMIISQFREFYLQRDPFNAPFSLNIDTALSW
ncbi:12344_t:CDS:2 [Cetraspora pellucida]|uniref:12344_t:CDS:1 n=1 Tax=Cetraspora pellucida TaxID=1433469 RepID=A0ACA9L6Q5_9GLOM|nr:12344_t:CDS:2 [Cetraspora pellucida]